VTDAFEEVKAAASANDSIFVRSRSCTNHFRSDRCTDGIVRRASSAATGFPRADLEGQPQGASSQKDRIDDKDKSVVGWRKLG
jgi:hypothetical protein